MARAAVWMRADSKVCHQLLEAQAFDAAEQVLGLHLEAVEGDLVFLHAAIAEHLDLGAGHARRRERIVVGAARLLGEQHGEAAIAGLVRIGAHQQRHQIGAHRMGDPGLVAVDLVDVALAHRARLQRGEIGAGIRFGEHRGRQHFAGGDLRQPFRASAPRCRRRGSVRPRSRSGCRASRRRYSRATVPRRRRTSIPCRAPCRRILPGWSARTRRARPSAR